MNCETQFVDCNTCVIWLAQSYCMQLDSKRASSPPTTPSHMKRSFERCAEHAEGGGQLGRVVRKRRDSCCDGTCIFSARGGHEDVCWSRKRNNFRTGGEPGPVPEIGPFWFQLLDQFWSQKWDQKWSHVWPSFFCFLPGRNRIPNMSRFRFRKTVQKVGPFWVPFLGPKVVPFWGPKMVHVLKKFNLSRHTALLFLGTHKSRLDRRGACEFGGGRGRVGGRR